LQPRRAFRDTGDREWSVYEVIPADVCTFERLDEYRNGWLVFLSGSERRRLAPVPHDWDSLESAALCDLLSKAGVRTHFDAEQPDYES
jgi:hypothetical protein